MTDEPEVPEPQPAPRSEMMEVVMTVVGTLNEVITALRGEVVALGESERRGRNRITVFLAVLVIAAAASVIGVVMTYTQGDDVKSIVKYVQDCQQTDSECKRRNDDAIARAVASISGAVFDATSCVQALPLAERTDGKVKDCRDRYIGVLKK